MSLHKEISFETEVCQYLSDHGWLYADGDAAAYDRGSAGIACAAPCHRNVRGSRAALTVSPQEGADDLQIDRLPDRRHRYRTRSTFGAQRPRIPGAGNELVDGDSIALGKFPHFLVHQVGQSNGQSTHD